MSGMMYNQPSRADLLNVISGGASLPYGYNQASTSQPAVDLQANALSTPVKLMQKFVNDRGWGSVDVTGMNDWRGNPANTATLAQSTASADADKWAALAALLRNNYRQDRRYDGSSHDSTGAGGYGR